MLCPIHECTLKCVAACPFSFKKWMEGRCEYVRDWQDVRVASFVLLSCVLHVSVSVTPIQNARSSLCVLSCKLNQFTRFSKVR